jgi:hypothetical protein
MCIDYSGDIETGKRSIYEAGEGKMSRAKSLNDTIEHILQADQNALDEIIVSMPDTGIELLREGKWIKGRFDRNIRVDQPTHLLGKGQPGAHVYGRKDKKLVLVVNMDGTGSHGTKGRLHAKDADALRARGFKIPKDNIIEWMEASEQATVLFG